jgi:hypothetical protein
MKYLIFTMAMILLSSTLVLAKPTNFAGSWTLDKEQSKDLPSFYENVKSHKLNITQDEKTLNVGVEINDGRPEIAKLNFVYNLDGTESKAETKIRTPNGEMSVPTTLKAETAQNGILKITISRDIMLSNGSFKGITVESWELSGDGKTLKIHRADDTPRGKLEFDMIFVKS